MIDAELKLAENRKFWGLGEVIMFAWPAIISMLNGTIMMFVDGMMVSQFDSALAGQFAGGMIIFVLQSFGLGVLAIIDTFVSQNYGAGNNKKCGIYAWNALTLALIFSIAIQILHLFTGSIFELANLAPAVQEQATLYASFMISNTLFFLAARILEHFFFGIGKSKIVLVASVIANVCNVVANYILIFGKLGFPEMGLKGAAIGTVFSSGVLMITMLIFFLRKKYRIKFGTANFKCFSKNISKQIIKVGLPAGIQFCSDMATWALFSTVLIGQFGKIALTANTVVVRYLSLSFMPAVGLSISATALVGRYIGLGRKDIARKRARASLLVALAYMGICGALFLMFREELMRFYLEAITQFEHAKAEAKLSPADLELVVQTGIGLFFYVALFQLFDAMAISYSGALKGTGDTLWPMIVSAIVSWGALVGLGVLFVQIFPGMKEKAPWLAASVDIMLLGLLFCWRFESGRWEKIDLLKQPAEPEMLDTELEVQQKTNQKFKNIGWL